MAKSLINLGTTPNDRTGDTLRDAGSKVNSNINELYTALGNGTTLGIAVTGATNGQVLKFNGTSFVPATDLNTDAVTSVNTKTGAVSLTADDIAEASGSPTNLYFTTARARAAISASGALAYNSTTGALTFTQGNTDTVAEGATNQYYTSGRFDFRLSQKTTDNLTEGVTNRYFSNTLARATISVSGDLSYNSTTGVISYTEPTIPADVSDLTDTTNLIPVDLSDLTDTTKLLQTASASAPATASSAGTAGQIAYDSGYVYVCVATDTWKRAALTTW